MLIEGIRNKRNPLANEGVGFRIDFDESGVGHHLDHKLRYASDFSLSEFCRLANTGARLKSGYDLLSDRIYVWVMSPRLRDVYESVGTYDTTRIVKPSLQTGLPFHRNRRRRFHTMHSNVEPRIEASNK